MRRYLLFILVAMLSAAAPAMADVFSHAIHWEEFARSEPCSTCHQEGSKSIVPDRKVCQECHEDKEFIKAVEFPGLKTHGPVWALNHTVAGRGKNLRADGQPTIYNCYACHGQEDCLQCHAAGFADEMGAFSNNMINVHLADFSVTHPIGARTDPQLCVTCHQEVRFCQDCHNRFAPEDLAILSHRKGWSNLRVSDAGAAHENFDPSQCQTCHIDSVLPSHDWSERHGREARKNLVSCQACHPEGDICLTCHSAVTGLRINPHPAGWDDIKGRLERASGGRTCAKCH